MQWSERHNREAAKSGKEDAKNISHRSARIDTDNSEEKFVVFIGKC
jgi:hypothetical protein